MANSHATSDGNNGHAGDANGADTSHQHAEVHASNDTGDLVGNIATVGVICVAAALWEFALVPGMIIGVGATLIPRALPRISSAIEPAFRSTVRGAYKLGQKARHAVAEAEEQVRDVMAEVHGDNSAATTKV